MIGAARGARIPITGLKVRFPDLLEDSSNIGWWMRKVTLLLRLIGIAGVLQTLELS